MKIYLPAYMCVLLQGDESPVEIGKFSNVQDGCTVGGMLTDNPSRHPTRIGNNVTIGHSATLVGCTVEDECLVGMGATVMHGAKVCCPFDAMAVVSLGWHPSFRFVNKKTLA